MCGESTKENSRETGRQDAQTTPSRRAPAAAHVHTCDLDVLLLAGALVGGSDRQDAIGVDVKLDLDLQPCTHATRWNAVWQQDHA